MSITSKKYLDIQGLGTYDGLSKERTNKAINDAVDPVVEEVGTLDTRVTTIATYDSTKTEPEDKLTGGVVKGYIDALLDGKTIMMPVYYVMIEDPDNPGQYIHVYNYEEATGTAVAGVTYYERTGTGSTLDPYKWIIKVPQPEVGSSVEGLYTRGDAQETVDPDEVEINYPVPDPEDPTKQKTVPVTFYADNTQTTIINTLAETATIPDNEIADLFE